MDSINNNEEYKELTKEEALKLNLTELLERMKKAPKSIWVNDDVLYANIESLIEKNVNQLYGEHKFHCVYQKPLGSTERYALIHTDYEEGNGITYDNIGEFILKDGKLMQQKLIEAKLEFDYFFIMPYFNFADKKEGSVLFNNKILTTNELEKFEKELSEQ